MKIAIIIDSNDPETVWNAFRYAVTTLIYDHEVTVFLLGKGVEAPTLSTLKFDVEEQINMYRENGGTLVGCGICCENRIESMPTLAEELNCELGSMQRLYAITIEADKILTF